MIKKILLLTMVLGISTLYAQKKAKQNPQTKNVEAVTPTPPPAQPQPPTEGTDPQDSIFKQLNLTADQQVKIKTIKANAKSTRTQIRQDNQIEPNEKQEKLRELRMKTDSAINNVLNAQQKEKLETIRITAKIEKIASELGLNQDQKNKLVEAQKMFNRKIKDAKEELHTKLKSFFSEEQFKKYMERTMPPRHEKKSPVPGPGKRTPPPHSNEMQTPPPPPPPPPAE